LKIYLRVPSTTPILVTETYYISEFSNTATSHKNMCQLTQVKYPTFWPILKKWRLLPTNEDIPISPAQKQSIIFPTLFKIEQRYPPEFMKLRTVGP